jgi:alkylhydroperoxidase family enzyme
MSRVPTPTTIEAAPAASRPLLEAVKKQLGVVPNMFRLIANSPAALEGYLGLSGALNKGALPAPTRERIALAVAEMNGCNYCLSAHTYSERTSPSSTMRSWRPTATAPRPTQRRTLLFASRSRSFANGVTSAKKISVPSGPPGTTMPR